MTEDRAWAPRAAHAALPRARQLQAAGASLGVAFAAEAVLHFDAASRLTAAEYAEWADRKMPQTASELTALLPAGLRLEWTAPDAG